MFKGGVIGEIEMTVSTVSRPDDITMKSFLGTSRRNQFILGPRISDRYKYWHQKRIGDSFYLSTHPDLQLCQSVDGERSLTLLGFILDPDKPQQSNSIITDQLMKYFERGFSQLLIDGTEKLGGRWIIIAKDSAEIRLFTDAVGLRQVFFSEPRKNGELWCASQADMIAEVLHLAKDEDALKFLFSWKDKGYGEYWWPGGSCLFKGVQHLLPNHYLSLKRGRAYRYWPCAPVQKLSIDEVVERSCRILRGTITAVALRFELVLLMTAGWDSRLTLAACKDVRDQLNCMTVRKPTMTEDHADLRVPSVLLHKLGIPHDIITSQAPASEYFIALMKDHVPNAHDVWIPDLEACLEYFLQRSAALNSGVSEVGKCFYRMPALAGSHVTARRLAIVTDMEDSAFAIKHYSDWLSDIEGKTYNFNVYDLFYWEQRAGRWLSMALMESDIAWYDVVTPYNCRQLLTTLLSSEEKYRRPPTHHLYRKMIDKLWPEVLSEPINPEKNLGVSMGSWLDMVKKYVWFTMSVYKSDIRTLFGSTETKIW